MASLNTDVKMNYCRLCGREDIKPDELFHIFGDENFVKNLERYIQMHIFVEDIDFSHHVCIPCKDKVEMIVEIITGFQQNQREQHLKRRNQSFSCPVPLGHIKGENLDLVDVGKPSNMCSSNAETTIKFTLFMPEVPRQDADGGPNTSISVVADPDEWPTISTLGPHHLKQLGKKIYDKYHDDIVKTHHKTLTVTDIRNELENLEDPLQGEIVEPTMDVYIGERDTPLPIQNGVAERTSNHSDGTAEEVEGQKGTNKSAEPLRCSDCMFTASRTWYLNQHYNHVHAKPFSCDECDRTFGHASKLRAHVAAEHTDQATLTCKFCEEKFTQKYQYTKHMKTHRNNDQLWSCDECDKQFSHLRKLNFHKSRYHGGEELPCPQCDTFIAKNQFYLKQHIRRVHYKLFECAECGKKVNKKMRLVKHIQNKHGQKPTYECECCYSKYISKKWYDVHVRTCPLKIHLEK